MTRLTIYWAIALTLAALAWAGSLALYPILPAKIPTHWNLQGQVNAYGSKTLGLFLMPAMLLLFLGLFRILPYLSPKNFEIETFHFTYLYIMVVTTGLFAYLHAVMLFAIWQNVAGAARPMDIGRVLTGGIFLFFALLGNVMGKIKRNFYIGVRTPWGFTSIGTETYAKPR